jgi:hypothetical protein
MLIWYDLCIIILRLTRKTDFDVDGLKSIKPGFVQFGRKILWEK